MGHVKQSTRWSMFSIRADFMDSVTSCLLIHSMNFIRCQCSMATRHLRIARFFLEKQKYCLRSKFYGKFSLVFDSARWQADPTFLCTFHWDSQKCCSNTRFERAISVDPFKRHKLRAFFIHFSYLIKFASLIPKPSFGLSVCAVL